MSEGLFSCRLIPRKVVAEAVDWRRLIDPGVPELLGVPVGVGNWLEIPIAGRDCGGDLSFLTPLPPPALVVLPLTAEAKDMLR